MQNQRERIKSLEEILRENPQAVAYWRDLRDRPKADPLPEFDAPTCDVCGGFGFVTAKVPSSDPRFGKPFACPNPDCKVVAERRADRYAKLCNLSQIPAGYQGDDVTFAGWAKLEQIPAAIDGKRGALGAALAFIAAHERGFLFTLDDAAELGGIEPPEYTSARKCSLVFTGKNGVGKTSLAVSIGKVLLEQGVMVIYMRLAEFFDGLKDRFEDKPTYQFMPQAGSEAELLALLQQAPVLIIDEFYADVTDWRKERAEQLVNYRYTHQLPTIITTNLDMDTLSHLWGLTTGHRIQAMAHVIRVDGIELRERAGEWVTP